MFKFSFNVGYLIFSQNYEYRIVAIEDNENIDNIYPEKYHNNY